MNIEEIIETHPQFLVIIEPRQIKLATSVNDLVNALWDFDQWLRGEYKYKGNEAAAPIREQLHEFLADHGLNLEKLCE